MSLFSALFAGYEISGENRQIRAETRSANYEINTCQNLVNARGWTTTSLNYPINLLKPIMLLQRYISDQRVEERCACLRRTIPDGFKLHRQSRRIPTMENGKNFLQYKPKEHNFRAIIYFQTNIILHLIREALRRKTSHARGKEINESLIENRLHRVR